LGQDLLETFPPITEKDKQNYPCIDSHPFQIQFLSAENFYTHPVFRALIGEQPVYSAYVQVTNLSHKTWQSSYGKGSINLSYRYIDPATGQIFRDGEPTFLTQPLAPGKTQAQHMLIFFPKTKIKNPIIRFTIQQQNCAWFDDDEKTGYVDVPLKSLPTLRNAQNF
jgi:hypothetical protein